MSLARAGLSSLQRSVRLAVERPEDEVPRPRRLLPPAAIYPARPGKGRNPIVGAPVKLRAFQIGMSFIQVGAACPICWPPSQAQAPSSLIEWVKLARPLGRRDTSFDLPASVLLFDVFRDKP